MALPKDNQARLRYFDGTFVASITKPADILQQLASGTEIIERLKSVPLTESEAIRLFPEIALNRDQILDSRKSIVSVDRSTGRVVANIDGDTNIRKDEIVEYADTSGTYVSKNPGSNVKFSVFKSETDMIFPTIDRIEFLLEADDTGRVQEIDVNESELLYTEDGTYTVSYDEGGIGLQFSFDIITSTRIFDGPEGPTVIRSKSVSNIEIINPGNGYESDQAVLWRNPMGEYIVKEILTDGTWSVPAQDIEEGFYYTFSFFEESQDEDCIRDCGVYLAKTIRIGNRFEIVPQAMDLVFAEDEIQMDPDAKPGRLFTVDSDSVEMSDNSVVMRADGVRDTEVPEGDPWSYAVQFEASANSNLPSSVADAYMVVSASAAEVMLNRRKLLETLVNGLVTYLPKNIILGSTIDQRIDQN